jgi:Porin subfamily
MMRTILLIVALVLSASVAPAQQSRDGKPDKPAKSLPLRPARAAANPCAEYGAGFVRIEGSSTCIKIGGSIGVGVGVGTSR